MSWIAFGAIIGFWGGWFAYDTRKMRSELRRIADAVEKLERRGRMV